MQKQLSLNVQKTLPLYLSAELQAKAVTMGSFIVFLGVIESNELNRNVNQQTDRQIDFYLFRTKWLCKFQASCLLKQNGKYFLSSSWKISYFVTLFSCWCLPLFSPWKERSSWTARFYALLARGGGREKWLIYVKLTEERCLEGMFFTNLSSEKH